MESELATAGESLVVPEPTPAEPAIEVRGLKKGFRIPTQRVDTLKERATSMFSRREFRRLEALRGIDFEVHRGEFFGIVGRNGSGKSTLLKLLASIYQADGGRVRVAGRIAPCIELGVGFNPDLAAFDNVVLNGVMMGLSPQEARARYPGVIEFAELGEYTDLKLKNYSSGMLVRLGFSLMTQVDADVLLIDEVLAVGDAAFQQKCFDAFATFHRQGTTIVLVTHDIATVASHCDRAMLLEGGKVERIGDPAEVGRRYLELNFPDSQLGEGDHPQWGHSNQVIIRSVSLSDPSGAPATSFAQGEPIHAEVELDLLATLDEVVLGLQIYNGDGLLLFASPAFPVREGARLERGERVRVRARIANPLAADHYFVCCSIGTGLRKQRPVVWAKNAADFQVYGTRPFEGLVELEFDAETLDPPAGADGR
jgi:ABC-2 type transport system ATP-binding protein